MKYEFPWTIVGSGMYSETGPEEACEMTYHGHTIRFTPTEERAIHSGRRRTHVKCMTCRKVLHEMTTGPRSAARRHWEHVAAPTVFEVLREHSPEIDNLLERHRADAAVVRTQGGAMRPPKIVAPKEWLRRMDAEPAGEHHPCSHPDPKLCDCKGACSCHFEEEAMTDMQLTYKVTHFDTRRTYVRGCGDKDRYSFSSDGTLVCRPNAGNWRGKVVWTGYAPHYYEIRFEPGGAPAPAWVMVRPLGPPGGTIKISIKVPDTAAGYFREVWSIDEDKPLLAADVLRFVLERIEGKLETTDPVNLFDYEFDFHMNIKLPNAEEP